MGTYFLKMLRTFFFTHKLLARSLSQEYNQVFLGYLGQILFVKKNATPPRPTHLPAALAPGFWCIFQYIYCSYAAGLARFTRVFKKNETQGQEHKLLHHLLKLKGNTVVLEYMNSYIPFFFI